MCMLWVGLQMGSPWDKILWNWCSVSWRICPRNIEQKKAPPQQVCLKQGQCLTLASGFWTLSKLVPAHITVQLLISMSFIFLNFACNQLWSLKLFYSRISSSSSGFVRSRTQDVLTKATFNAISSIILKFSNLRFEFLCFEVRSNAIKLDFFSTSFSTPSSDHVQAQN